MAWHIATADRLAAGLGGLGKTLLRLPGEPETWRPILDVEVNQGQLGDASFGRIVFTVPHDVVDFDPQDRVEYLEVE